MNITRQPIGRGLLWLSEGLRIMSKQPIALFALTFMSLAIMVLPSVVPLLGTVASLALQPAIYVGLMTAIRAADNGQSPHPRMLFSAFTADQGKGWQPLLMLGAVNATLSVAGFGIASLFVGWHKIPVGKSLFFSVVAVWRNKGAFITLFLGWFAILFVVVLALQILILGLGLASTLMSMLIAPLSMLLIAAAYCSFWVSYKDVIRDQDPEPTAITSD